MMKITLKIEQSRKYNHIARDQKGQRYFFKAEETFKAGQYVAAFVEKYKKNNEGYEIEGNFKKLKIKNNRLYLNDSIFSSDKIDFEKNEKIDRINEIKVRIDELRESLQGVGSAAQANVYERDIQYLTEELNRLEKKEFKNYQDVFLAAEKAVKNNINLDRIVTKEYKKHNVDRVYIALVEECRGKVVSTKKCGYWDRKINKYIIKDSMQRVLYDLSIQKDIIVNI